jgi:hypothetical protein
MQTNFLGYMLEVICFIKKYMVFMAKNMDFHGYNT